MSYYVDESVTLFHGDALEVLTEMDAASVDAVVTDPPYGLEFMGREWDSFKPSSARLRTRVDGRTNPAVGKSVTTTPEAHVAGEPFQRWCQAWAAQCLRVLKPGGFMLAFGGTRTVHRLTCGIEDAGFEIRDGIDWLYGSGFPKSLDVGKAIDAKAGAARQVVGDYWCCRAPGRRCGDRRWDGWGTALKPAREPIVVARKPLSGTVAGNVLAYGTGALNIDGCRIEAGEPDGRTRERAGESSSGSRYGAGAEFSMTPGPRGGSADGRWPTNVVFSHTPDCAGKCVPGCPVADLDTQSGTLTSGRLDRSGITAENGIYGAAPRERTGVYEPNSGGASRFFPVFRYEPKAPTDERPRVDGVAHETVKPLDLMRWLVRLVTPPGGLVLDLFAGSGTTGEACIVEGLRCTLIERDARYLPLIRARLAKDIQPVLFDTGEGAA